MNGSYSISVTPKGMMSSHFKKRNVKASVIVLLGGNFALGLPCQNQGLANGNMIDIKQVRGYIATEVAMAA